MRIGSARRSLGGSGRALSALLEAHSAAYKRRYHLHREEDGGAHNMRESGTLAQMRDTVARLVGHRLLYRDLIAPNGLPSGARF